MTVIQWVTTSLIAALGLLIAYRQWMTANYKLKLDLFDRRFKVYEATRDFLSRVLAKDKFDFDDLIEHVGGIEQAPFLFPDRLTDHLKEIRKRAIDLRRLRLKLEVAQASRTGVEAASEADAENVKWLSDAEERLVDYFRPHLDFRQLDIPLFPREGICNYFKRLD